MRAMMSRLCAELTPEGRGTDGAVGKGLKSEEW